MLPALENSYRELPPVLFEQVDPIPVAQPQLIALNIELAETLGFDTRALREEESVQRLAGNRRWADAEPIALAYAGHQFGGFSGRLGDGRAHLLGERIDREGNRLDLQLKGSGPTPYSRGGDGRSSLGPVLREYLVSEWMHRMGVPTTRALAAVSTGEQVYRETPLPGGVLTRVASSHLRVGTFEFLAAVGDLSASKALVNYALQRHFPDQEDGRAPALRLLDLVISQQAALIPQWMGLGFIHGVMNTDNCTISGETIDYGPCALMDIFDPARKFSSIDRGGRYAYNQQAKIAQWNLARLAEALLPLIPGDEGHAVSTATELLHQFPERYERNFATVCRKKLGLKSDDGLALKMMSELLQLLREGNADFTLSFRRLYDARRTQASEVFVESFDDRAGAEAWFHQLQSNGAWPTDELLEKMRLANPLFIPRNHRMEEVIESALQGDLKPFHRLNEVLGRPCEPQHEHEELAQAPGDEQWSYVTFCGT